MEKLIAVLEGILFAWAEPLALTEISRVLDIPLPRLYEAAEALEKKYAQEDSGLKLIQVKNTLQLSTKEDCFEEIEKFFEDKKKKNLSNAGLESLAIIAYKQPVTKVEVEDIRGVQCDSIIRTLMKIGYVEQRGTLDRPGKPSLYGTTDLFLKKFGLKSIKDLPDIDLFKAELNLEDEEE